VTRRTRTLALFGLSAACAGLAASLVNGYARQVRAQVGPLVPVLVARVGIERGERLTSERASSRLSIRRVPERFAPPNALRSPSEAVGLRAASVIAAGDYVGRADLIVATPRVAPPSAAGARLVELPIAGGSALRGLLRPGGRVDVLVTSEQAEGSGRTYLALQRIELADLRPHEDGDAAANGDGRRADSVATLRVTLRQAVLLTAAQNFAREVRLVPRPPGDDRRLHATAVSAAQLRP
jgi:pilus assembly protein CpaB